MSNIFLLYKTEIRKILAKKSVWAAMAVSIVLVLLTGLANLSADGHSAYVKEQETRLTALSGSPMDDAFLESFKAEMDQQIACGKKHKGEQDRAGSAEHVPETLIVFAQTDACNKIDKIHGEPECPAGRIGGYGKKQASGKQNRKSFFRQDQGADDRTEKKHIQEPQGDVRALSDEQIFQGRKTEGLDGIAGQNDLYRRV